MRSLTTLVVFVVAGCGFQLPTQTAGKIEKISLLELSKLENPEQYVGQRFVVVGIKEDGGYWRTGRYESAERKADYITMKNSDDNLPEFDFRFNDPKSRVKKMHMTFEWAFEGTLISADVPEFKAQRVLRFDDCKVVHAE